MRSLSIEYTGMVVFAAAVSRIAKNPNAVWSEGIEVRAHVTGPEDCAERDHD